MRIGSLRRVIKIIKELNSDNNVLIVTHKRADADAYISAYLLSLILKYKNVPHDILIPQDISTKISNFIEIVPLKYKISEENIGSSDLTFFLDVGGPAAVPDFNVIISKSSKSLLLDHHYHNINFLRYFDQVYVNNIDYASTSEIVYDIGAKSLLNFKSLLNYNIAKALICAILIETRFLQLAKGKTLLRIYNIMKYIRAKNLLIDSFLTIKPKMERSEKIAMLKGMQRLEIYEAGNFIISLSHLSSYQASLASKLLSLGVDIALVFGISDDECKVSIRLSEDIKKNLNIHAVKTFIKHLSKYIRCQGGGHEGSAMITFKCKNMDIDNAREIILSVLNNILSEYNLKLSRLS